MAHRGRYKRRISTNTGGSGSPQQTLVSGRSSRKQLLVDILDALNELNDQGFDETHPQRQPDLNEAPCPSVQDDLGSDGIQPFLICQSRIRELESGLENLEQRFRQLGSAGMTSPSYRLRTRLSIILGLFRKNTLELFPKFKHQIQDSPDIPWSVKWKLKLDGFPEELELLAKDLTTFLRDLHEFPELTHEPLKASILTFIDELEYWAYSVQDFKGQFQRDPAVQRYMHDICGRMDKHLLEIISGIHSFVDVVIPAIKVAKQQTTTTFLSLSSLATFMSAVTATGIQMVFNQTDHAIDHAVNAFWFTSLVFSVASAVNSLLGLAWSQSPYRSSHSRVPWWISVWIRRSPLVFLVISLVAFSMGLVLFTWASNQHLITCLLTTLFTGIGFFSLLSISLWFAFERSTFIRHNGHHLLVDILNDLNCARKDYHLFDRTKVQISNSLWMFVETIRISFGGCQSTTEPGSPLPTLPQIQTEVDLAFESARETSIDYPVPPVPQIIKQAKEITPESRHQDTIAELTVAKFQNASIGIMQQTETIPAYQDSVSHMQFSPDGKWLATCGRGQDKTSLLFYMGTEKPGSTYQTLAHPFSVRQVVWAPKGGHLITLQLYDINIWKEDGSYVNTIVQHPFVESVIWLKSGHAFLALTFSLEGTDVKAMDLNGNILASHHMPRLDLCDLSITPDDQYMLSIGSLIRSSSNLQVQEKKETRIIMYNMKTKTIESQVPVSHPLQNLVMSCNGRFVLVSSSDGSKNNPAQLWELIKYNGLLQLSLCRTYIPSEDHSFPSRTHFGGKEDQLIFCSGGGGHINIWDRDSGELLRTLEPNAKLTCIAWNGASNAPMFATGSVDGKVSVWTVPLPASSMSRPGILGKTLGSLRSGQP